MNRPPQLEDAASFVIGGGETGALVRAIDWSRSRLGPAHLWPQSLRTTLGLALSSRFPIAVYWGPEFVMLYNDDLIPMVGASKHPLALGRPAFEVLPEIRALIEPLLRQVVETGEPIWSEDLMLPLARHHAPEESYFTFTYSPIRDEAGAVAGVFCAVVETTDKVIEGRRLRLLNAMADATRAKTPAEACAVAATHITRAPADVPFALLYLLDDASTTATLAGIANLDPADRLAARTLRLADDDVWPLTAALASGKAHEIAFASETHRARGAVILPIERSRGGPHGFIVAGLSPLLRTADSYSRFHNLLASSVSQSVGNAAAYEAERQRAEALATLDRAKTTFFSNISHEFRTPLTLMLAPIQDLLAAAPGAAIDRSTIELLDRNAQRLLKLVNTLLEFSRIEAGRVEASYEPVELAGFTIELASTFQDVIERGGVALVVDCPPLPEAIFVDRDMWERVVLNLLSNAFKFTFEGSITVRLRATAETVVLEVADTGTGIAASELPRLFERFHRIEGARSRSHEGSGIGLALIEELVRLHGGQVRATSTLGAGTTFEVEIPRGTRHLPADRVVGAAPRARSSSRARPYVDDALRWTSSAAPSRDPEAVEPAATGRPRILVVDDNADMREYVTRLLRERWDVESVSDGAVALEHIKRDPPALVLSDVMMPGLDGFGLVAAIRSTPELQAIPIILLSARAGQDETARGLACGANDYIAKPFSARELLVRMASALATAATAAEMVRREQAQRSASERARRDAEAAAHAQRAVREFQERFVAVLGHDLRNPLAAIAMGTGVLAQQETSPANTRVLTRISASTRRMSRMVEQILDLSRARIGGGILVVPATTDLHDILSAVIEESRAAHPHRTIELRGATTEGVWDRDRLEQVFSNLIGNALHHGAASSSISVTSSELDDRVRIDVHNHGAPIPDDVRASLFEPFRQGHRDHTRTPSSGLGLGLFISREIALAHGGELAVASTEAEGTTFTLLLPRRAPGSR